MRGHRRRHHGARRRGHLILLLDLDQELRVVLDFVLDMLSSMGVLLASSRRRVGQKDSAVFAEVFRHFLF